MMRNFSLLLLLSTVLFYECSKTDFLDAKPDQSLVVPTSLEDFQAILDNDFDMNGVPNGLGLVPELGEIGSDDYYLTADLYQNRLTSLYRDFYTWSKDANSGDNLNDWDRGYNCVFMANIVLDGLSQMKAGSYDMTRWKGIRAAALFYRAHAFYQLAQVFSYPFGMSDSEQYGIPLRLNADVSEKISRSTITETYMQITKDLMDAVESLPATSAYKERPSKAACHALLARVYLSMRDYNKALDATNASLAIVDGLLDYNKLSASANFPFQGSGIMDTEVLFKSTFVTRSGVTSPLSIFIAKIDSNLYQSYVKEDLRKAVFFRTATPSGFRYKGSFYASTAFFVGLATDEVYLIKAECLAKLGKTQDAVETIEKLRRNRFSSSSDLYKVPASVASDQVALLKFVRDERRRELIFRGLRWTDLRRYNMEGETLAIHRVLGSETYTLEPNDKRYAFLIPSLIMGYNPDMAQNPR
ncbi:RagB/SusD family nutrient uptake outer membrane protein [Sphingobacterium multivorum]|uniref:RagB/SusD family nutrient uptake outer membrane protein n=1 Tax=Sphingobacterium multivorum TaxID=28454 RepID=UPI0028B10EC4|nr:RagB/SusD family nutrient uptake outer membrane protein [Sphingobacterium multivorum]